VKRCSPRRRQPFVVTAQPIGELHHLGVAPHPSWKSGKGRSLCLGGRGIADVAVYPGGIRPIRLYGDNGEAVMSNELTRYRRPRRIKLRRSMRGLAK
jgi:hypothetical protein